ncbi:hypothetical protein GCM10027020_32530 [Nocardioides salsibiostraticola]
MSEDSEKAEEARHPRLGVRWISLLLGAVVSAAVLATPVIDTPSTVGKGEDCTAGGRPDLDTVFVLESSDPMAINDSEGLRKSATIAFVNGMNAQSRAAVVDFDDHGQVVQGLTADKGVLIAAIDTIDDQGGADLGAGVRAALDELADHSLEGREQAIVLMTDGRGSYDVGLTAAAAVAGVQIFTIGLGLEVESALLRRVAEVTGGIHSLVGPVVGPLVHQSELPAGSDTDADGLSDCEETQGAWDARGERHVTDVNDPDSDGDGLTDGQEVTSDLGSFGADAAYGFLHLPLGAEAFRYVVSDPNDRDTDADGAADGLEFDLGTQLFVSDSDGDGLNDFEEVDQYGTNPLDRNTDGDKRDDGWEVDNASAGFDPTIFDEELSKLTYAKDFIAGATCPDGFGFCETDSIAYLAGSMGGGLFAVKDVLDVIGNLTTLDFVGAGLAAVAIVPVAGDVSGIIAKSTRFLKRVPAQKRADGLAAIAKADISTSARMQVLHATERENVSILEDAGMSDDGILAAVGSRIQLQAMAKGVRGAGRVEKSPRVFATEKEAQDLLVAKNAAAIPEAFFRCPGCPLGSTRGSRRVDLYDPSTRTATEIKIGHVRFATTRDEVAKDVALLRDPATPIDSVVWHFYPKAPGAVGPDDELREALTSNGILYVVHLP